MVGSAIDSARCFQVAGRRHHLLFPPINTLTSVALTSLYPLADATRPVHSGGVVYNVCGGGCDAGPYMQIRHLLSDKVILPTHLLQTHWSEGALRQMRQAL